MEISQLTRSADVPNNSSHLLFGEVSFRNISRLSASLATPDAWLLMPTPCLSLLWCSLLGSHTSQTLALPNFALDLATS